MNADWQDVSFEEEVKGLALRLDRAKVELRGEAAALLNRLACAIDRWNKVMNLVSRKDIGRLASYHFADSASVLPILRPRRQIDMLDVGGSNGLPGLVLSALSPHLRVKICDSRHKRQDFLREVCDDLGVDASFEIDRVDSAGFQKRHARIFDLVVARAVTALKMLFTWCLPLLKPGGILVAYKGSRCLKEVAQAEEHFFGSGGRMITVVKSPWADECNPLRLFAIAASSE
jgi:16S rRNA (guanine527-N7)-methyltransferase